jgi:branched-subunit amino acid ABC-type transport system permease component
MFIFLLYIIMDSTPVFNALATFCANPVLKYAVPFILPIVLFPVAIVMSLLLGILIRALPINYLRNNSSGVPSFWSSWATGFYIYYIGMVIAGLVMLPKACNSLPEIKNFVDTVLIPKAQAMADKRGMR